MSCHAYIEYYAASMTLLCLALLVVCVVQAVCARRVRRSRLDLTQEPRRAIVYPPNDEDPYMDAMMARTQKHFRYLIYGALAIALAIGCIGNALAQTPPITFGASVTNANGELDTTLTWEAVGASGCMGSGHPDWDGDKEASGTQQLPTIALSGTYALTLTCTFPGDRTARLSWTPPTENTDGSALTNLAGYSIHYGRSTSTLSESIAVDNAGVSTYTLEDLSPGQWFFAVRSRNDLGVESALSNVVGKTITASTTSEASVSLTVNPVPRALVLEVH